MLASYHEAAATFGPVSQRPIAFPVSDLAEILRSRGASVPGRLASLAVELSERISAMAPPASRKLVIHGDFTAHNVLADGTPSRVVGVIDFALAHVEDFVADLAFGLWRSGRPDQDAPTLDPARVRDFIGGYRAVRGLPPDAPASIPVYLWGRGVQMLVKAVLWGRPLERLPRVRIEWLRASENLLADAIIAAMS